MSGVHKKVFYVSKNKFTDIFIKNSIMVKLSENGISYSKNWNIWDSGKVQWEAQWKPEMLSSKEK